MGSETRPLGSRVSDQDMRLLAIRLIVTIHRQVDWQRVDPRSYWERMPAALRARAQTARSPGEMIESLRRALQLRPWSGESASAVSSIARDLDDVGTFRRFCRLVRDEGALLAAEARVALDEEREERRA